MSLYKLYHIHVVLSLHVGKPVKKGEEYQHFFFFVKLSATFILQQ